MKELFLESLTVWSKKYYTSSQPLQTVPNRVSLSEHFVFDCSCRTCTCI